MVQRLFDDIKDLRDEIRRLKGRLDSLSIGTQLLPVSFPSTAIPPALENALIQGNATPLWARTFSPNIQGHINFLALAAQDLVAADAILATATLVTVTAAGGDVTLTSTPTVADGADGQLLIIMNIDAASLITLQDQGTLALSNLRLEASTVVLGPRDSITLIWSDDIDDWVQVGYSDVL